MFASTSAYNALEVLRLCAIEIYVDIDIEVDIEKKSRLKNIKWDLNKN